MRERVVACGGSCAGHGTIGEGAVEEWVVGERDARHIPPSLTFTAAPTSMRTHSPHLWPSRLRSTSEQAHVMVEGV